MSAPTPRPLGNRPSVLVVDVVRSFVRLHSLVDLGSGEDVTSEMRAVAGTVVAQRWRDGEGGWRRMLAHHARTRRLFPQPIPNPQVRTHFKIIRGQHHPTKSSTLRSTGRCPAGIGDERGGSLEQLGWLTVVAQPVPEGLGGQIR